MSNHRTIIAIGVPASHDGRFLFEAAVVGQNDQQGNSAHGRMSSAIKFRDFFIGLTHGADVKSYRITTKENDAIVEGYVSWLSNPAIQNVNPFDQILDIEADDGVITPVDGWESWDKRLVEIGQQYPRSTTKVCETAIVQIVLNQLLDAYELDSHDYEAHFYHQGSLVRAQIAQRVEDDWRAVALHHPDNEEDILPVGKVANNQKAPTELLLHLISAATDVDQDAGITDRGKDRKRYLGKPYATSHVNDTDERYYPVVSVEQHPRLEASVIIKGWLFAFHGAPQRGEKNAKSDFIRSLIENSKATVDKAQLNDPDLRTAVLDAFAPSKERVSISLDEPGALKTFFLGDVLADLEDELAKEVSSLWPQSADEVDLVKAALAYQRSSVVQIEGIGDPEPLEEAPLTDQVEEAPQEEAPQETIGTDADTSAGETAENAPPKAEVEIADPEPEPSNVEDEQPEIETVRSDSPENLLADLERIRTEGNAKPDTRFKKMKARLREAGEADVFIGIGDLCQLLDDAGFTINESVQRGLRVTMPNDAKVRTLTGQGQGDIFYPAYHAVATCRSIKASAINGQIVEALAHPVLGPPLHWPKALLAEFKAHDDPAERLADVDGACAEILIFRFLEWLLSDPKDGQTPKPDKFLAEIVGDASAVGDAIARIAATAAESPFDEGHDAIDEAAQLWTGDLKSGEAFYEKPDQQPKSEDIIV